jgi:hypothetical protein
MLAEANAKRSVLPPVFPVGTVRATDGCLSTSSPKAECFHRTPSPGRPPAPRRSLTEQNKWPTCMLYGWCVGCNHSPSGLYPSRSTLVFRWIRKNTRQWIQGMVGKGVETPVRHRLGWTNRMIQGNVEISSDIMPCIQILFQPDCTKSSRSFTYKNTHANLQNEGFRNELVISLPALRVNVN